MCCLHDSAKIMTVIFVWWGRGSGKCSTYIQFYHFTKLVYKSLQKLSCTRQEHIK